MPTDEPDWFDERPTTEPAAPDLFAEVEDDEEPAWLDNNDELFSNLDDYIQEQPLARWLQTTTGQQAMTMGVDAAYHDGYLQAINDFGVDEETVKQFIRERK